MSWNRLAGRVHRACPYRRICHRGEVEGAAVVPEGTHVMVCLLDGHDGVDQTRVDVRARVGHSLGGEAAVLLRGGRDGQGSRANRHGE